jgi:hypothetical protein
MEIVLQGKDKQCKECNWQLVQCIFSSLCSVVSVRLSLYLGKLMKFGIWVPYLGRVQ